MTDELWLVWWMFVVVAAVFIIKMAQRRWKRAEAEKQAALQKSVDAWREAEVQRMSRERLNVSLQRAKERAPLPQSSPWPAGFVPSKPSPQFDQAPRRPTQSIAASSPSPAPSYESSSYFSSAPSYTSPSPSPSCDSSSSSSSDSGSSCSSSASE